MNQPELPSRPSQQPPPQSSWVSIILAGFALVAICLVLFFLTLGTFFSFVMIAGAFFLFVGMQYLIWGRWLQRVLREADKENDESSAKK